LLSTSTGYFNPASVMNVNNAIATKNDIGFLSQDCGSLYVSNGTASFNITAGFWAGNNAFVYVPGGTAKNNATGYASWWNSLIVALSTSANNSNNTTNYAPPTSGTVGNIEALIQWS
jgi:hypothetical protein